MYLEMGTIELLLIAIVSVVFIVGKKVFRAIWVVKNTELGDKVVTAYGVTGTLMAKGDKYCTLEISSGMQVEIKNTMIARKLKPAIAQPTPQTSVPQQHQPQTPPPVTTRQTPPPRGQQGVCSKCQKQNKPGDRFCEQCGAPLG
jgi:preprotein translocase subunit YajC